MKPTSHLPEEFRKLTTDLTIEIADFPSDDVFDDWRSKRPVRPAGHVEGAARRALHHGNRGVPDAITLYGRPIIDYWAENEETLGIYHPCADPRDRPPISACRTTIWSGSRKAVDTWRLRLPERATSPPPVDFLIPVLVTGIQPDQVPWAERTFPRAADARPLSSCDEHRGERGEIAVPTASEVHVGMNNPSLHFLHHRLSACHMLGVGIEGVGGGPCSVHPWFNAAVTCARGAIVGAGEKR